jgi:hypothetical protein
MRCVAHFRGAMKLSSGHYRHKGETRQRVVNQQMAKLLIAFINWIGVERAGQFQMPFTVLKIGPSRQAPFEHLRVRPLYVHLSDGVDQPRA